MADGAKVIWAITQLRMADCPMLLIFGVRGCSAGRAENDWGRAASSGSASLIDIFSSYCYYC